MHSIKKIALAALIITTCPVQANPFVRSMTRALLPALRTLYRAASTSSTENKCYPGCCTETKIKHSKAERLKIENGLYNVFLSSGRGRNEVDHINEVDHWAQRYLIDGKTPIVEASCDQLNQEALRIKDTMEQLAEITAAAEKKKAQQMFPISASATTLSGISAIVANSESLAFISLCSAIYAGINLIDYQAADAETELIDLAPGNLEPSKVSRYKGLRNRVKMIQEDRVNLIERIYRGHHRLKDYVSKNKRYLNEHPAVSQLNVEHEAS